MTSRRFSGSCPWDTSTETRWRTKASRSRSSSRREVPLSSKPPYCPGEPLQYRFAQRQYPPHAFGSTRSSWPHKSRTRSGIGVPVVPRRRVALRDRYSAAATRLSRLSPFHCPDSSTVHFFRFRDFALWISSITNEVKSSCLRNPAALAHFTWDGSPKTSPEISSQPTTKNGRRPLDRHAARYSCGDSQPLRRRESGSDTHGTISETFWTSRPQWSRMPAFVIATTGPGVVSAHATADAVLPAPGACQRCPETRLEAHRTPSRWKGRNQSIQSPSRSSEARRLVKIASSDRPSGPSTDTAAKRFN